MMECNGSIKKQMVISIIFIKIKKERMSNSLW